MAMGRLACLVVCGLGCRFDVEIVTFDAASADAAHGDANADAVPADGAPGPDVILADASVEERCASRYGSTTGYIYCEGDDLACRFVVDIGGVSCESRCAAAGGVCLDADDTSLDSGQPCIVIDTSPTCATTTFATLLCTCTQ